MQILTIALALLCQDPVTLQYGTEKSKAEPVRSGGSLTIKVEGTDTLVNHVNMSHPIFALQKVEWKMEGTYECTGKARHKLSGFRAHVEGIYDDEEYTRDFQLWEPPENLGKDMFELILWAISMGPETFTRKADGTYMKEDKDQDAFGEALAIYTRGAIRMPKNPVQVGDSWTSSWTTKNRQKDNGGRFKLTQKAVLKKIETRGGYRVAVIEAEMSGKLDVPKGRKDKSAKESWTKTEGRMSIELEIETGRVLVSRGEGKVHAYYRGIDPETGGKSEVNITFGTKCGYEVKKKERKTPSRGY